MTTLLWILAIILLIAGIVTAIPATSTSSPRGRGGATGPDSVNPIIDRSRASFIDAFGLGHLITAPQSRVTL